LLRVFATTARSKKTFPQCELACADDLELYLLGHEPEKAAAFIFEPVAGATLGAAVPPEGYGRAHRGNLSQAQNSSDRRRSDERHGPHGKTIRSAALGHRAGHDFW